MFVGYMLLFGPFFFLSFFPNKFCFTFNSYLCFCLRVLGVACLSGRRCKCGPGTIILHAATKNETEELFNLVDVHSRVLSAAQLTTQPLPAATTSATARGGVAGAHPAGHASAGIARAGLGGFNSPGTTRKETLAEVHARLTGDQVDVSTAILKRNASSIGEIPFPVGSIDGNGSNDDDDDSDGGGRESMSGGLNRTFSLAGGEDTYARLSVDGRSSCSPFATQKSSSPFTTRKASPIGAGSAGSVYSVLSPNRSVGSDYEVLGNVGRTSRATSSGLVHPPQKSGSTYSILSPVAPGAIDAASAADDTAAMPPNAVPAGVHTQQNGDRTGAGEEQGVGSAHPNQFYAVPNPEHSKLHERVQDGGGIGAGGGGGGGGARDNVDSSGVASGSGAIHAFGDLGFSHGSNASIYYSEVADVASPAAPEVALKSNQKATDF